MVYLLFILNLNTRVINMIYDYDRYRIMFIKDEQITGAQYVPT